MCESAGGRVSAVARGHDHAALDRFPAQGHREQPPNNRGIKDVMKYEGIWIQRGQRLVRSQERNQADEEFADDYERLYGQGHIVLLVAGKNYGLDELFFFETAAEARHFYDGDLSSFECSIGDEHEACGFAEVSHYVDGLRITTKPVAPSARIEVSHEPADMKVHRTGRKIVQQDISDE